MVHLDQGRVGQPVARPGGYGGQGLLHVGRVAVAVVFHQRGPDQPVLASVGGDGRQGDVNRLGVALAIVKDDGRPHQGDGARGADGGCGPVGVPGRAAALLPQHERPCVRRHDERAAAVGRGDGRHGLVDGPGRVVGPVGGDEPVGRRLHQVARAAGGYRGRRFVGGMGAVAAVVPVAVEDERISRGRCGRFCRCAQLRNRPASPAAGRTAEPAVRRNARARGRCGVGCSHSAVC